MVEGGSVEINDELAIAGKIALSGFPIVGSVVNELVGYADMKKVHKRLDRLRKHLENDNIILNDFAERLNALENDEHKYYVVRNGIKHLCISALPETVDALNKALIEIIMKDEYGMAEHATEIIMQLNAEDIATLKIIKQYIKNAERE